MDMMGAYWADNGLGRRLSHAAWMITEMWNRDVAPGTSGSDTCQMELRNFPSIYCSVGLQIWEGGPGREECGGVDKAVVLAMTLVVSDTALLSLLDMKGHRSALWSKN